MRADLTNSIISTNIIIITPIRTNRKPEVYLELNSNRVLYNVHELALGQLQLRLGENDSVLYWTTGDMFLINHNLSGVNVQDMAARDLTVILRDLRVERVGDDESR